jgi:hypothetical protein
MRRIIAVIAACLAVNVFAGGGVNNPGGGSSSFSTNDLTGRVGTNALTTDALAALAGSGSTNDYNGSWGTNSLTADALATLTSDNGVSNNVKAIASTQEVASARIVDGTIVVGDVADFTLTTQKINAAFYTLLTNDQYTADRANGTILTTGVVINGVASYPTNGVINLGTVSGGGSSYSNFSYIEGGIPVCITGTSMVFGVTMGWCGPTWFQFKETNYISYNALPISKTNTYTAYYTHSALPNRTIYWSNDDAVYNTNFMQWVDPTV